MATATSPVVVAPESPWRPAEIHIFVGLKQLCYFLIASAIEDAQGRKLHCRDDQEKRMLAADGLRWLRDYRSTRIFSLSWCADVLGVDARMIASVGLHRVAGGGLANWRTWRKERNISRLARHPKRVFRLRCVHCHRRFATEHKAQKYCGSECFTKHQQSHAPVVHVHTCPSCHQRYEARHAGQTYCSRACMLEAQREQRNASYRLRQQERECACV